MSFEVREVDGRLVLAGELDLLGSQELLAAVDRQVPTEIDLSGLWFMDSSGLGCLVGLRKRWVDLRIGGELHPMVARVIEITGAAALLFDGA
jgi:anti-anti-sigma factor